MAEGSNTQPLNRNFIKFFVRPSSYYVFRNYGMSSFLILSASGLHA